MIGKILGAIAGERIAGPNNKLAGALVGAAVPVIARRGLGTLGLALEAGWGAKKLIDRSRARKAAEAQRDAERDARDAADARNAALEEELRKLRERLGERS